MDDILEAIFGELLEGIMGSRRIPKLIKCILVGILGGALTALCIVVGGVVGWLLAVLMVLMTIMLIRKLYLG